MLTRLRGIWVASALLGVLAGLACTPPWLGGQYQCIGECRQVTPLLIGVIYPEGAKPDELCGDLVIRESDEVKPDPKKFGDELQGAEELCFPRSGPYPKGIIATHSAIPSRSAQTVTVGIEYQGIDLGSTTVELSPTFECGKDMAYLEVRLDRPKSELFEAVQYLSPCDDAQLEDEAP